MLKKITILFTMCIITLQGLICMSYANDNYPNNVLLQGVIAQFDSVRGTVEISGKLENSTKGQYITVLAVPGGTDMKTFTGEDILYISEVEVNENNFSIKFDFSQKTSDNVDIYIGGTGILNSQKKNITPEFEYVLVDSISFDTSNVMATAYMRNYSDTNKSAAMILVQYDEDGKILDMDVEEKYISANTYRPVICTLTLSELNENTTNIKAFVWNGMNEMIPLVLPDEKIIGNDLKVLAIGNSFSVDSVAYLYQIAENAGMEDIKIGNLYIGNCSLETHWNNAKNNSESYIYYKNTTGVFEESNSSIYDALKDEDWDIIVMQQRSGMSGQADSYEPYLTNLMAYVNIHKTNPNAVLAWNMTWAYEGDSTHQDFPKYNNDQLTMYNAICDTVQNKIASNNGFEYIIPAGTAIQNMRTSYIGDNLTRDGFHLSVPMGRYIAGLTWFETFTDLPLDSIDYAPTGISADELNIIKEAVNNAIEKPFEIVNSSYKSR